MRRCTVAGGQSRVARWLTSTRASRRACRRVSSRKRLLLARATAACEASDAARLRIGRGVGERLALDDRGRDEGPAALTLAVDEGEHADDLAARRLHRQDQQGLGPVAGEGVHLRVEAVRAVGGQRVGVGHVEDLAGERHVTGQALRADRQRDGVELDRHAVVLGQLEAQAARAVGRGLHQVDRARVAPGDVARLGQDQLEQELGVALAREAGRRWRSAPRAAGWSPSPRG